jgi:hypothetical protein
MTATMHQYAFDTSPAVPSRLRIPAWWTAAVSVVRAAARTAFTALAAASQPPAHTRSNHYAYIENALMSREMDRL